MDVTRAKQIVQSPNSIQVLYQDSPVWIDSINENNTADVTRLDSGKNKLNVPVYMLIEKHP